MNTTKNLDLLSAKAKEVSGNSYSPYSNFKVGVALEDADGNIFTGCNVENLAFPSGVCAEQTAICKAVSEVGPGMKIKALVVYTPTTTVTTPCGACRQVINEFVAPDTHILCYCDSDQKLSISFSELFPASTEIEHLQNRG